jgi:hypothetical protein
VQQRFTDRTAHLQSAHSGHSAALHSGCHRHAVRNPSLPLMEGTSTSFSGQWHATNPLNRGCTCIGPAASVKAIGNHLHIRKNYCTWKSSSHLLVPLPACVPTRTARIRDDSCSPASRHQRRFVRNKNMEPSDGARKVLLSWSEATKCGHLVGKCLFSLAPGGCVLFCFFFVCFVFQGMASGRSLPRCQNGRSFHNPQDDKHDPVMRRPSGRRERRIPRVNRATPVGFRPCIIHKSRGTVQSSAKSATINNVQNVLQSRTMVLNAQWRFGDGQGCGSIEPRSLH